MNPTNVTDIITIKELIKFGYTVSKPIEGIVITGLTNIVRNLLVIKLMKD